ncbi:S8 family serine peptidase [Actinoplanes solisilvae]|uniref:S8 family serine peptidase n=1 Tax=Actinoplanes solisilvae TaxID=2486853 RepID=UPI000FDAE1D0|nr:S8 family serine peptidase [Actinoplanes solisilvae]
MHHSARRAVTATAAAVLLFPAVASPAHAAPAPGPQENRTTVTLITGDVVTVRGTTVSTATADGKPAAVRVVETKSGLYVYPLSALPHVASGLLDRDLFNVSQLVADGYDDAHSPVLPLIVRYADGAAARKAAPTGSTRVRDLPAIGGAALEQDRDQAASFWAGVAGQQKTAKRSDGGVEKIWLDGRVRASLADTTTQIGAPKVWAAGNTGTGVTVAVLDTGADTGHPDLAGRINGSASFVPGSDVLDRAGHGTHVASTIAGTGAASSGAERGVAPGARLDIGKVLGDDGSGQDSWVIAGMQWAAVERGAKVINMSLGNANPTDGTDPLSEAVDRLSEQTGALFVVAAGNAGGTSTIGAPGAADEALTVGAVDRDDQLAYFSSRGPRLGDQGLKPEITAPGVDVLAARSQLVEGDGMYTTMSGTSMATPHVAGAAALVLAAHPGWTGRQVKDALVSSSTPTPHLTPWDGGTGRLDAAAATAASVIATGAVSAGAKTITYTNAGDKDVVLSLAGPGFVTLSANKVTAKAHGSVNVTVTYRDSTTNQAGIVTASDSTGRTVARSSVATGPVRPFHWMTLKLRGQDGKPMGGLVELMGPEGSSEPMFVPTSGDEKLLLPEGHYSVLSFVEVQGAHGPMSLGMALIGDPEVRLRGDTTVVLDASKVRRISTSVPRATTDSYARLDYFRSLGGESFWRTFWEAGVVYDSFWAQPAPERVTSGDFHLTARWRKETPELSVTSGDHTFDDLVRQGGTTRLPDGTHRLTAVDATNGFAGAKGKVAVVRHTQETLDGEQAAAAAEAGVKLLLVVNDTPGRTLRDYGPSWGARTPIEVALVSKDEGERLLAELRRGRVTLTVAAATTSDFVYDLVQTYEDRIPADLTEEAGALARIPVDFTQPRPSDGGEFRFDYPAYNDRWGIGGLSSRPLPQHRVDFVSTGGPYRWGQEAYVSGLTFEIGVRQAYRPGAAAREVFFAPITRPYLNNNYRHPSRDGNTFTVDVPGFGTADHVGFAQGSQSQTTEVYQGSTLLGRAENTYATVTAGSAARLPYRVVVRTEQDGPLSTRTETEWGFRSAAGTPVLPLIQLRYDRTAVTPVHLTDADGAGRLGAARVEVSYDDGKHWVARTANPPRGAAYVSIRTTASDSAGNTVKQTVIRAFPVR